MQRCQFLVAALSLNAESAWLRFSDFPWISRVSCGAELQNMSPTATFRSRAKEEGESPTGNLEAFHGFTSGTPLVNPNWLPCCQVSFLLAQPVLEIIGAG